MLIYTAVLLCTRTHTQTYTPDSGATQHTLSAKKKKKRNTKLRRKRATSVTKVANSIPYQFYMSLGASTDQTQINLANFYEL